MTMTDAQTQQPAISFEEALTELDTLVTQLESQQLNLQDALKYFERGIMLTRNCQEALQYAEQRVEQLSTTEYNQSTHSMPSDQSNDPA